MADDQNPKDHIPLEPLMSEEESDEMDERIAKSESPGVKEAEERRAREAQQQRAAERDAEARDYDKPLCPYGPESWRVFAIIAGALALAAAITALVQTPRAEGERFWQWMKPACEHGARVLLGLPVQFAAALGAFALAAWYVGRPPGSLAGAAPRLGLIVALVTLTLRVRLGFTGDALVAWAIAAAVYFFAVLALFRVSPRVAGVFVAMHLLAWALIEGLAAYVYWTT